jgi:hypothetical protein
VSTLENHLPHGPAPAKREEGLFAVLARAVAVGAALAAVAVSAACGGSVSSSSLPIEQDFADCGGFGMNDEVATVDCPEGELRIVVSMPAVSPMHLVPLRFDERPRTLRVTGAARATSGRAAWGLGCLASEPGEASRGYVLVTDDEGSLAILRLEGSDAGDGRQATEFGALAARRRAIRRPAARHSLGLTCATNASGRAALEGSVDGRPLLAASDRSGFATYTAALPFVVAERPGTEVRFDDVTASNAASRS